VQNSCPVNSKLPSSRTTQIAETYGSAEVIGSFFEGRQASRLLTPAFPTNGFSLDDEIEN
jgi:hypothetical protein